MFDKKFDSEKSIKKWANGFAVAGVVLFIACSITAFILFCVERWLWWVALTIFGSGAVTALCIRLSAILMWGFADIIGNTRRTSNGEVTPEVADDELPDL